MVKIITSKQIQENLNIDEVVEEIKNSYRLLAEQKIVLPPRIFTPTKDGGDYLYGGATNLARQRFIVLSSPFMPWNKQKGLPIVRRVYLLTSFEDGELLAVVEGSDITNIRTCAKSLIVAKHLARKDSTTLGVIGLGAQAKYHAEILCKHFPIDKIVGYCRKPENWQNNIKYIKAKTNLDVEVKSREEVIQTSDILIVATHSKEPLVKFEELHKGQLVIGLDHAESVSRDLVLKCDKTFVDYLPTALSEFGPVKLLVTEGYDVSRLSGELSQLVTGEVKGRETDDEIIFFQSLGVTNEDMAVVELMYEKTKDNVCEFTLD